jgi:hypothetical protein
MIAYAGERNAAIPATEPKVLDSARYATGSRTIRLQAIISLIVKLAWVALSKSRSE